MDSTLINELITGLESMKDEGKFDNLEVGHYQSLGRKDSFQISDEAYIQC